MARIKGSLLVVRRAYLERRSAAEKRAVLRALPEETRELMESETDPSAWYPLRHMVALNRALADHLGMDDEEALLDVGRFAAEVALADVRDSLMQEGGPGFLFRQAPSVWHQHYDSGNVLTRNFRPESGGTFVLQGFDDPHPEICGSVRGWIWATIELTGVDDVEVEEVRCRCRGDEACEFRCSWRGAD